MRPELIFLPMVVLVLHTLFIFGLLGKRRLFATRQGRAKIEYYSLYQGEPEAPELRVASRNLSNLMEFPILLYIGALVVFLLQRVDTLYLVLCWAFVASRFLHSLIHVTYNHVVHRFLAYFAGCLVLLVLWARIGFQIMAG